MNHVTWILVTAAAASLALVLPLAAAGADDSLKALVRDEARICRDVPLDHNVDATTAYRMATAQKVPLVDVRTPQEYQFVGHVPGSYNIPVALWGKWDEKKSAFGTDPNPEFVKQFSSVFPDKKAPVLIVCRSGHRSGKAIKLLAAAGYTNLYQLWEGFEGIAVAEKDLPSYGKKVVDGWRNRGLPYTWDMDGALVVVK